MWATLPEPESRATDRRRAPMSLFRRRGTVVALAVSTLVLGAACTGTPSASRSGSEHDREKAAEAKVKAMPHEAVEKYMMIAGLDPDEAGKESKEAKTLADQFAEARTAPGVVSSGAYTAAYKQLSALPSAGGSWADVTKVPYNSDDPRYRDFYSNSSGGSGYVSGRITGIAVGQDGVVYAASADGGVWRSLSGKGGWVPITDNLPTLSSGELTMAGDGSLWYASGEANTGGTAYVGAGVYRLEHPEAGALDIHHPVG